MLPAGVLCLSLVFVVSPSMSHQPLTSGDPKQKIFSSQSHPSWSLGLQVYRALRSEGSHINTIISPVLLANSLSVLSHTANGATARQLQKLLKTEKDEKQAKKSSSNPFISMRNANGTSYTLRGSSAIFSKQVPTLESSFLEELQAQFELDHVALGAGDKQDDIEKISSWAKRGMGGVKQMPLNEGPDAKEGALILASALHFKGFWDHGFDKENKDLRSFLGTKYTKVYMMHRAGVYRHYEDIENMVQVLELGLWGGKASMVLLLPFHVESLARLERVLTLEQLENWLGKLSSMSMALSLPRVNISSTLSLQEQAYSCTDIVYAGN
ncbi:serine (or cysteine) peptidase inhibitor, clade H, member 2 isoform X1 [Tachysurus ichikawai]